MLASERTVPVFDVGNPELVLAKGRVVEVVEFSPDPAVKGVFLNADLKAVGVVLVDRAERGREGNRKATEGDLRTKERRVWVCMPILCFFYAKRESLFCRKEEESKDCRLAVRGRSKESETGLGPAGQGSKTGVGGFEGEAELGGFVRCGSQFQ